MKCNVRTVLLLCYCLSAVPAMAADGVKVASDGELSISASEFAYLFRAAPLSVRSKIRNNDENRFELVATTLASKKILASFESMDPQEHPDLFHAFQFAVLAAVKELDESRFQSQLTVPNFEEVAEERYRVSKDEIAVVPESRVVSHILLLCTEECEAGAKRAELEAIRASALSGESFSDLAIQHSQDPGSSQRGGRLSQPIVKNAAKVDQAFRDATFALEEPGDISEVVQSRFGFHIIRLDDITAARMLTFEEVKQPLVAEVEQRYREDAYRNYLLSLGPSDELIIDYQAIDEILGVDTDDTSSEE